MERKGRRAWFVVLLVACAGTWTAAGEQPTTPTRSVGDDFASLVRQRLAQYQPVAEQLRKRSANELQKLGQWEYKVVSARTSDTATLTAVLNQWGEQGWECFEVVSATPLVAGNLPSEHLLFFRKHKGSWLSQIPIRDILKLLLYLSSEPGQTQSTP